MTAPKTPEAKARKVERDRLRRQRIRETLGTDEDMRHKVTKDRIRERFHAYILDGVKSNSMSQGHIRNHVRDWTASKVTGVVVVELLKELEDAGLIRRYEHCSKWWVKSSERNILDTLFAPFPKMEGFKREYEMEDFGHVSTPKKPTYGIASNFVGWDSVW